MFCENKVPGRASGGDSTEKAQGCPGKFAKSLDKQLPGGGYYIVVSGPMIRFGAAKKDCEVDFYV